MTPSVYQQPDALYFVVNARSCVHVKERGAWLAGSRYDAIVSRVSSHACWSSQQPSADLSVCMFFACVTKKNKKEKLGGF